MALQARALLTSKWLAEAVKAQGKMRILDTSWYLPKLRRNAKSEFKKRHIPGAAFFDIDQCCDKTSPLDHMLPSEEIFADYVGNLGIESDTHVVLYDASEFGAVLCAPCVVDVPGVRAQRGLIAQRWAQELGAGGPRGSVTSHIPGSISIPFHSFLSQSGHFLPKEQLQALFARAGVDLGALFVSALWLGP
ncbi:3-mercaptopyruvate sulfurtransferase [Nibea albiflora]|nr:3-mercaptopyruvate sulfurtransferase [Nibea albiflora]